MLRVLAVLLSALALGGAGCNLREFFDDPRCYSTADCFDGKVCSANLCVPVGSLGTGRKCWATRDCQAGQNCQLVPEEKDDQIAYSQRCLPGGASGVGGECKSAVDCMAGLRCELVAFSGTCALAGTHDRGDSCTSTAECLAGLACGPDQTCAPYTEAYPSFGGVTCAPESGAFRAYFEVPRAGQPIADFFRLPFPNDARVDDAGRLDMSDFPRPGPTPLGVDLVQLYVDALVADFEGYSAVAPITFRYADAVDAGSLATAATIVDVTPGQPHTKLRALATAHASRTKYSCADRVVVEHAPGDVLLPRHTYAVLLRGVRSAGGALALRDADFEVMLGGSAPDAARLRAWAAYSPLRGYFADEGLDPGDVQVGAVFTVGDSTAAIGKIASLVRAAPAPVLSDLTLCSPGAPSPCGAAGDGQRVCGPGNVNFDEIHGRLTIPIFQQGTAPYLHPSDGGGIDLGSPQIVRTEQVCFAMSVPKGTAPQAGWPLVVHAHGTGGSFHGFIDDGVAGTLATGTTRFAVLSFDGVQHGARKNGSPIDSKGLVFNILNPRAARDNVLQSGADVMQALRVASLAIPNSVAGRDVRFDPQRVAYHGHSQGGNAGVLGLAYATEARAAVLSGAGGGVVDGVLGKTNPVNVADGMKYLLGEALDVTHPAMLIFQNYFDRSDPQVYAPLFIRRSPGGVPSKHVLHTYGLSDTYAPPKTLANLNKALGIPLVQPVLESIDDPASPPVQTEPRPIIGTRVGSDGSTITAATFQYDPAGAFDGHFVATQSSEAVADWKFFFDSYVLAGTPHVP